MRLRRKVWIVIIAVCIGLSVYEIPKARSIWREARAFKYADDIFEDKTEARPARISEIIASDPEAADILHYCITDPNIEELAVFTERYPQNEFFLAQLIDRLIETNLVDLKAILALIDRLIELNPENAHYRYLKGWAILNRPGEYDREKGALEQFEAGNQIPLLYLPYSRYKERVGLMGEKLYLNPIQWKGSEFEDVELYFSFWKLVRSWDDSFVPMDKELLRKLTTETSKTGVRLVDETQNTIFMGAGTILLMITDSLRLKEFNLTNEESEQARFRICQAIEIRDITRNSDNDIFSYFSPMETAGYLATIAVCIFLPLLIVWLLVIITNLIHGRAQQASVGIKSYILFFIGLCIMFGLRFLLVELNELFDGWILRGALLIGAAVIVWILLWLLSRIHPVDHSRFSRARRWSAAICGLLWAVVTIIVLVDCIRNPPPSYVAAWLEFLGALFIWFLLCTIIWAIGAYRQHLFRVIPYGWLLRNRFVQLILVLLLMTGISAILKPIPLAPWTSIILTILIVGLFASHRSKTRFTFIDGIRHFFDKDGEIAITRMKIARITGTSLIICWVTVLAANHAFAYNLSKLNTMWSGSLSHYDTPLPQATQETYERVVLGKDDVEAGAIQTNEKRLEFNDSKYLYLASPEDILAIITERKSVGKPFSDKEILGLLKQCGRDVRAILLNEIQDPNAIDIFQKIEWGDKIVKEELEQIFEEEMASFSEAPAEEDVSERGPSQLEKLLELAGVLASLSEPEEAKERLLRLLKPVVQITNDKPEKPGLFEGFTSTTPESINQARQRRYAYEQWRSKIEKFFASLGKVPKPRATELFKLYLSQTQIIHHIDEQDLDNLTELIEKLSDRELAEQIFKKVIESPPVEETYDIPVGQTIKASQTTTIPKYTKDASHKFFKAIYPHLNKESVPLLLEHLDSDNEQLRSFVVWRLTSLGYGWTSEQLGTLLKDNFWKVRLNALFACNADDLEKALYDEFGTVRVVAQILSQVR